MSKRFASEALPMRDCLDGSKNILPGIEAITALIMRAQWGLGGWDDEKGALKSAPFIAHSRAGKRKSGEKTQL